MEKPGWRCLIIFRRFLAYLAAQKKRGRKKKDHYTRCRKIETPRLNSFGVYVGGDFDCADPSPGFIDNTGGGGFINAGGGFAINAAPVGSESESTPRETLLPKKKARAKKV